MKPQTAFLLFALATPLALYAQAPIAWWENPVAVGLSLTDAQRDRVSGIAREFRERLIQKREETERAEREFEEVFNADVVDSQRGSAAIERLAKARAELTRDLSQMTLQMRAVLTTEQWRELQSRRAALPGFGEGRGKGPQQGRGRGFPVPPTGDSQFAPKPRVN